MTLGDITVAAIGQADDTVLVSNDVHNIQNLLDLSLDFCSKYHVQLCVDKTKLQVTASKELDSLVDYQKATSPVNISGKKIPFVDSVDHVGILRSSSGNLPSVLRQITAHKRQLGSILHTGIARGHHGNPAASLRVQRIYGLPVLMSGLGTLVLNKPEKDIINQHYKVTLENLMRLHKSTPECVVYFLSGSLPGIALLHLRQLSLLGMVTRLQGSILHTHALNVYRRGKASSRSWFFQLRDICLKYSLPHPSTLLECPLTKLAFKNLTKKAVISFWEKKLRDDAKSLKSLEYFRPEFMSLSIPHPIWLTAKSSSYEVIKATVQAKMLSGRYRTGLLSKHWSTNRSGYCLLPSCNAQIEDLAHILVSCPSLNHIRTNLLHFTKQYLTQIPEDALQQITSLASPSSPLFMDFLLDCSTVPCVIVLVQKFGPELLHDLFHLSRTWCYSLHKERLKLLGRWKFK